LLGTGGHQAHNKYNKYSNSQPALLNLDQFTPLHKAGLMKKKDFNSLLLCLQQMLLFAMKEQLEDRAPREPLSDLNSLFDNPKEQAEAFMVQMICKQKLQMTINQKMVLLLCMLEIIADKKVSKAYFIFLCSKKDMEQMDFKSNASKQVSKQASKQEVCKLLEAQSLDSDKTKIKISKTCNKLMTHPKNFLGLTKFIFSTCQVYCTMDGAL